MTEMRKMLLGIIASCLVLFMTGCGSDSTGGNEADGVRGISFISGMGCGDVNCTDASHHHDCPADCTDYDHHHNCAPGCTEESHHHSDLHIDDSSCDVSAEPDAVSFISGMGCDDITCTDASHHHDCPADCTDYDNYHNCAPGCTEESHHHSDQHFDDSSCDVSAEPDAVSFISGMGCDDITCTDASHHHDCPADCTDYDHYHNCAPGCTEESHHHSDLHIDDTHYDDSHHDDTHHDGSHH